MDGRRRGNEEWGRDVSPVIIPMRKEVWKVLIQERKKEWKERIGKYGKLNLHK